MTINAQMSIGEVLKLDAGTARIFMQNGMHCLGCPHATAEPIQDACAAHGADPEKLVRELNEFLADK